MKMEMLEKLAGLHRELREEVQMVTAGSGASPDAIAAARDLLGLPTQECHLCDEVNHHPPGHRPDVQTVTAA